MINITENRENIIKGSPIPIYYQLKEYIRSLIDSGKLRPGMQVPSERELCQRYGISRMTARQALSELVKEGMLYRQRGKGTFVAEPKLAQPIMHLTSFSEDMHQRGMVARGRTVRVEILREDIEHICQVLELDQGDAVLKIERLRFADDEPLVFEISHFSYNNLGALKDVDLEQNSLYSVLEERFDIRPCLAKQTLEAVLADDYIASVLGVKEGSPLIVMIGVSYDQNYKPVEYVRSYYRGDRYKFYMELKR